jgi:glycosyltransferase involved in cell wall biosynthesis
VIPNKTCILVTTFAESQPGFLDFSYRIKSLATLYRLTVLSTFRLTQVELQVPNVNYVVIKSKTGRLGWLTYLLRCAYQIRQQGPNVAVLLHSMAAPIALFLGQIPSVTYWNEHPTHVAPLPTEFSPVKAMIREFVRWLMLQGARQSSLVMPIGEAHRDDLIAHGCDKDKLQMLYMGVAQTFSGVALSDFPKDPSEPLQLIYVGSVHKERGRDVMLEAMAIANRESRIAHLTIVGATEEQVTYCQNAVKRLGISDSVTIHGRVSGYEIPAYFRKADVGLCLWEDLPWYRFNPPTKLFEYLVAGLPVLASNIRTHTQYVEDGVNGLIFEYNSASLAQAIGRLWDLRAEFPQMKVRANGASSLYLWQTIEPVFLSSIQEVAR